MRFLYRAVLFVLLAALIVIALPLAAQIDLSYGTTVTGTTDTSYHFDGKEGDLVSAEAIGITADLTPLLTLLNSSGQQVAQAQSDPFTPGTTTLTYRLPLDGSYSLNVSGLYGKSGEFVLSLRARPISAAQALAHGHTTIRIDATSQAFHFAGPAEIHLTSPNTDFSAEIRSQPGELVAEIDEAPSAVFALDSSGEFELMLRSMGASGTVEIDYLERPDLVSTLEPQIILTPTEEATSSAALPFDSTMILALASEGADHAN